MDAAQLDTSGAVHFAPRYAKLHGLKTFYRWQDLSPFAQGYVEAMLAELDKARMDYYRAAPGRAVPIKLGFDWLAPEALAMILRDCEADLVGVHESNRATFAGDRGLGAAFWRARQAGRLTHSKAPPLRVFLNDDGKVMLEAVK